MTVFQARRDFCLQVSEYDCLLLEHVFGNRPDDSQKVKAWLLETIASDPGLQQVELVFLGLFGRACRILESQNSQVTPSNRYPPSPLTCGGSRQQIRNASAWRCAI